MDDHIIFKHKFWKLIWFKATIFLKVYYLQTKCNQLNSWLVQEKQLIKTNDLIKWTGSAGELVPCGTKRAL